MALSSNALDVLVGHEKRLPPPQSGRVSESSMKSWKKAFGTIYPILTDLSHTWVFSRRAKVLAVDLSD